MCGETNFRRQIGTIWIESALWGFYVPLYCASIYTIAKLRRHPLLYVISTANFLLSTAWLTTTCVSVFYDQPFVCSSECTALSCRSCGVETESYLRATNMLNIMYLMQAVLCATNQIVCDALVIWRCFILWNRNYRIIIFPAICLMSTTGMCLYAIYLAMGSSPMRLDDSLYLAVSPTGPGTRSMRYMRLGQQLSSASDIIPLVANIIVTSLTVGRILYMSRGSSGLTGTSMQRKGSRVYNSLISILIESGALVVVAYAFRLFAIYVSVPLAWMAQAILVQVLGIAPTLLIIHLAFVRRSEF